MAYEEVKGVGSIDIERVEWRTIKLNGKVYKYPRPMEISIEITHNCPAYCLMCSSNSKCVFGRGSLEGELSYEEILQILHDGKVLGAEVVSWSGGEPLIHEHMTDLLVRASELGYRQWLYTSGVVWNDKDNTKGIVRELPDETAEKIAEYCERVMIDMQHADSYMNDVIMGRNYISFLQRRTILKLKEYGVKWLEAQVVPMKINWLSFRQLVGILLEIYAFDRVSFLRFVPQGRGEQFKHWLYLTPSEMAELNKMLRSLQREYGEERVRIGRPLNFCFLFDDDAPISRCRAGFDAPLIQPSSRVDSCPAWKKMPDHLALGYTREKGLIWCWVASPVVQEIRSFVGAPIEEIRDRFKGMCVNCPYFERCRGKCTAQRMLAYNFDWYQTPDPQCPMIENFK